MSQYGPMFSDYFLVMVMMGFYPLSYGILEAFRLIEELAPSETVRTQVRFFVDVEEGKHAASDWYRGVLHSELYRKMFSSLATVPLAVNEEMLDQYLGALRLREGGLPRALVTATFIETTGLTVLQLLHDFVAQWQVLSGVPTSRVDLTYLNEHMLHEGTSSEDQHVSLINNMLAECGEIDLEGEVKHFEQVTSKWLDHAHDRAFATLKSL